MKAQVSMQFMFVLAVVFVFFVVFVAGFSERYNDIRTEKERLEVRDVVLRVHDEIAIAHMLEDGYVRNFSLPLLLNNVDYTISLSNNIVSARTDDVEYSTYVPSVTGTLQKGYNIIMVEDGNVCIGTC